MIRSRLVRINRLILPVTLCMLIAVIFVSKKKTLVRIANEGLQQANQKSPPSRQAIGPPKSTSEPERLTDYLTLTSSAKSEYEVCGSRKNTVGPLHVDKEEQSWDELIKQSPAVGNGGAWSPDDCLPEAKLALIIPYRERESHLKLFLRQIHPMLQRQRISYRIFVIEQADKSSFNRGKLMNVGYNESLRHADFDCFVFHDVDLIPENDENYYDCHISPAHLSVAVDKFNYKLTYDTLFGGVEMFTKQHFEKINGFSNVFWGWGAEDDNLYQRVTAHGMNISRPGMQKARYQMLQHRVAGRPKDKTFKVLKEAVDFIKEDGLKALNYRVLTTITHPLYTHIKADLEEGKNNVMKKIDKVISEKDKS